MDAAGDWQRRQLTLLIEDDNVATSEVDGVSSAQAGN